MKVVKWTEGDVYEGPGHFGCWGVHKVLAGRETPNMTVNVSQFIPDGGAHMGATPTLDKYYHVLEGTLVIKNPAGEEFVLQKNDGIYIAAGEERLMHVPGPNPCTVLVVLTKV